MSAVEGSYERAEEYPEVLDPAARRAVLVPENASPLVRELFELLNRHKITIASVARKSGVQVSTISDWRARRSPTVVNLQAVFNAAGHELVVRPLGQSDDDV